MPTTQTPVPETALARFESLYQEAERTGDLAAIPWDHDRANPSLVEWLDTSAHELVRCGCRVAVVGCGRGHDARELLRRGFDVVAFDCSATAVRLAKALDPDNAQCYFRADLLQLPPRWVHRFDLAIEIHTLQALPPEYRPALMSGIGRLIGASGHVLVITRAVDLPPEVGQGPPWPLTEGALRELAGNAGLGVAAIEQFMAGDPPSKRLRALLERGA